MTKQFILKFKKIPHTLTNSTLHSGKNNFLYIPWQELRADKWQPTPCTCCHSEKMYRVKGGLFRSKTTDYDNFGLPYL